MWGIRDRLLSAAGEGFPFLFDIIAPAAVEFFNPAGTVKELLLAGKERMALRAYFGMHLGFGAAGIKSRPATATDGYLFVIRMYFFFHYSCSNRKPKILQPCANFSTKIFLFTHFIPSSLTLFICACVFRPT